MARRLGPRRAWILRGALLVVSALAALIGAELACRAWILKDDVPFTDARFREIMLASHGAVPDPAAETRPVILGLGDSFGCAPGFGRNFFDLMRRDLDKAGRGAAVVNLSVPRYETAEELFMLRERGLAFRPRLVLQAFFVGNDTHGNPPGRLVTASNGVSLRQKELSLLDPETWDLPVYASRTLALWRDQREARRERAPGADGPGFLSVDFSSAGVGHVLRGYLLHYFRLYPKTAAWAQVRGTTAEMARLARASGADYALVILPDQLQVEDSAQERVFEDATLRRGDFDFALPQKMMAGLGRELGVPVIDLLPAFRARGRRGGFFLGNTMHWNDAGNRLAADVILQRLRALGLPRR